MNWNIDTDGRPYWVWFLYILVYVFIISMMLAYISMAFHSF